MSSCVPTARSGGRRERSCARERVGERGCPGPCGVDAQRCFASVKGQARGDVQQPVAQAFGLAACKLPGEQQPLGPDDQVVRDADEHQPDAVVLEVAEGHVPEAGVFVVADMRFGVCALALAALKQLDVAVGLVGERRLEAMAVVIGEGQLRAGMRTLAPDQQPGPCRPQGKIDVLGDLGDLPVLALAAVARER